MSSLSIEELSELDDILFDLARIIASSDECKVDCAYEGCLLVHRDAIDRLAVRIRAEYLARVRS